MKLFILAEFLGIKHVFSRNIEYIYKKSALSHSSLNLLDSISEENILAIILKKDINNGKCETGLKKYCKDLEEIDPDLDKVHSKVKKICKDNTRIKEKCENLKNEFTKNCTAFEAKLTNLHFPSYDQCKENEQKCLFLEGACPNLIKECIILKNRCYQDKRDTIAKEILLRALNGSLEAKCEEKLKEVCVELSQESDELMLKCFNLGNICIVLKKEARERCDSLKKEIKLISEKNITQKCFLLLEQCHFHWKNCNNQIKSDCDELKNRCEKQGLIYSIPGSEFNPMRLDITLVEKIGIKKLYEEAISDGIYIKKSLTKDLIALITLFVYSINYSVTNFEDLCNNLFERICNGSRNYMNFKSFCNGNTVKDKKNELCRTFEKDLKTRAQIILKKIDTVLFTSNLKKSTDLYGLKTFLSEKDCAKLLSECFYFESYSSIKQKCNNLKTACYKKGLEGLANQVLQKRMRGMLHGSNATWLKALQKELVKVCTDLKEWSNELFMLCLDPKRTALTVSTDLRMRAIAFREDFNEKRLYPTKNDCEELGGKCEDLKQDSKEIEWLCYALDQHCNRLRSIEQLEKELLEENKGYLKDENSCMKEAKKRCNKWLEKGNDKFSSACFALELACKKITRNVKSNCTILEEHIKTMNIFDKINGDGAEEICERWTPYCAKLMPNCKELERKETCDGECKKINDKCALFLEKKELGDKLIDKFKGSLSNDNDCMTMLDKYCIQLTNKTIELEDLCTNTTNTKNNTEVRKEFCKKLLNRIEEKCLKLKNELREIKDILAKKQDYESIREKAEKEMNTMNLVLLTAKTSNNRSINEVTSSISNSTKNTLQSKLIRKSIETSMAEDDLAKLDFLSKTFELVAKAFDLYVKLKGICQDSTKGCEFKKECKTESLCEEIEKVCLELKPLKINSERVTVIQNTTVITIKTQTTEVVKETQCTLTHTINTWITHTLTNTAIFTHTSILTSLVFLTTEKYKPTKCTTEGETGEIWPSQGLRMTGWSLKGAIFIMIISAII
ncbi:hypothetical protein PMAC_000005 [Pneumocystis sp. 'macacae']|nr:hypothetical protein PMAC_000005 [Pneumocystis sp. 'macacae']